MATDSDFKITPQTVYGRDESGTRLYGWTMEEILTVGGVGMLAFLFLPGLYFKTAATVLAYFYAKHLKSKLPERFLKSFWRFHTTNPYLSAEKPDTEWRSPVIE